MKHSKFFFLQVVLMSMMSSNVSAYDFSAENEGVTIYYNFDGNDVSVTYAEGYNSYSGNVRIPSTVSYLEQEYTVTSIGSSAFRYCSDLTSLEVPNSVTIIGDYAFYYCTNLASFVFPNTVTTIGDYSFMACSSLTSIEIPRSVTSIGEGAFGVCSGLTAITVDKENLQYDSRNSCKAIIEKSSDKLIAGCRNTVIPGDVTSIGAYAFASCGFTSVEIPNGVTSIAEFAFWNCLDLHSLEIPSSVTSIGLAAFTYCGGTNFTLTVGWSDPIVLGNSICEGNHVTLYVPKGTMAAYEDAAYWKDFKEIKEYVDGYATAEMGSSGMMTYSSEKDLDFTGVEDLRAYIASGYSPSTGELTMTRVYKVPAGEGLLLKGTAGNYNIPNTVTDMYYANLLVGVPTATNVSPTEGDYTNFILADGINGVGFYTLSSAGEIGANKAYLQLPTAMLPAAARSLRMVFEDDEEEVTRISEECRVKSEESVFFDLQGRRIAKPTKAGLYVKDGRKVLVK